jgi:hypothetical protein
MLRFIDCAETALRHPSLCLNRSCPRTNFNPSSTSYFSVSSGAKNRDIYILAGFSANSLAVSFIYLSHSRQLIKSHRQTRRCDHIKPRSIKTELGIASVDINLIWAPEEFKSIDLATPVRFNRRWHIKRTRPTKYNRHGSAGSALGTNAPT